MMGYLGWVLELVELPCAIRYETTSWNIIWRDGDASSTFRRSSLPKKLYLHGDVKVFLVTNLQITFSKQALAALLCCLYQWQVVDGSTVGIVNSTEFLNTTLYPKRLRAAEDPGLEHSPKYFKMRASVLDGSLEINQSNSKFWGSSTSW